MFKPKLKPTHKVRKDKPSDYVSVHPNCKCGHNLWQTLKKDYAWGCRKCKKVRYASDLQEVTT